MKSIKEQHRGEHRYLTHDNGGRPFLIYTGENAVTVYTAPADFVRKSGWPEDKNAYTQLIVRFSGVERKFIPKYPSVILRNGKKYSTTGNSILLKMKNTYVFIGDVIYEFKTDDTIEKYYSLVGNSDVPYPVAVGTENVYFMTEQQFVSKKLFPNGIDWEKDAYDFFYIMLNKSGKKSIKRIAGVKLIAKRRLL